MSNSEKITDYLITHAINNNSTTKTYKPSDNTGGKIEKQNKTKKEIELFQDTIIVP